VDVRCWLGENMHLLELWSINVDKNKGRSFYSIAPFASSSYLK